MGKPKIVFSKKCLEYGLWHIEGPMRVKRAYEILKDRGYEFIEPEPASEEDILRVHDPDYVDRLKMGLIEDPDTPAYEGIYEYARLSAGGAILAAMINGFSLMRPPGHHAGRRGAALGAHTLGFCYLN
ncbi:histone deacetylase family protein, partial [Candidatus Bathyarchaeota archaeon]|nr:histone deacetylase family protein [Candidatus Bathyarchaeota archaeon]